MSLVVGGGNWKKIICLGFWHRWAAQTYHPILCARCGMRMHGR